MSIEQKLKTCNEKQLLENYNCVWYACTVRITFTSDLKDDWWPELQSCSLCICSQNNLQTWSEWCKGSIHLLLRVKCIVFFSHNLGVHVALHKICTEEHDDDVTIFPDQSFAWAWHCTSCVKTFCCYIISALRKWFHWFCKEKLNTCYKNIFLFMTTFFLSKALPFFAMNGES